jgi:hypothetical protein
VPFAPDAPPLPFPASSFARTNFTFVEPFTNAAMLDVDASLPADAVNVVSDITISSATFSTCSA